MKKSSCNVIKLYSLIAPEIHVQKVKTLKRKKQQPKPAVHAKCKTPNSCRKCNIMKKCQIGKIYIFYADLVEHYFYVVIITIDNQ